VRKEALTEEEIRAATEALQAEGQNPVAQITDDANTMEGRDSDRLRTRAHSNREIADEQEQDSGEDGGEADVFDSSDSEDGDEWESE